MKETLKFKKLSENSYPPEKKRSSDSGYDVYAVEFEPVNEREGIYFADMKLAIQPPEGWYFELIGRSSLPLNNLHFLGGVGVIDKTYTGSIKMLVQKIESSKPLPELPFKCGQLIPRQFAHFETINVDELDDTERGTDGFGSTD